MSVFKCEHLTKKLDKYTLKDISFEIEPGTILGLIGINGSGKTTLLRCLLGSYRLDISPEDAGDIWLGDMHFMKNMREYKGSLAYILQDCPFNMNMRTYEVGNTRYRRKKHLPSYLKDSSSEYSLLSQKAIRQSSISWMSRQVIWMQSSEITSTIR